MKAQRSVKAGIMAKKLRDAKLFTPDEANVLRAAKALRDVRGYHWDAYTPEELSLLRNARRLAIECGQIKLGSYLILRKRGMTSTMVMIGKGEAHECPRCGRMHRASRPAPSKSDLAEEARLLEAALKRQP